MAKLWQGRFKEKNHPLMEAFTESISFDRELAEVDIEGSLAHAKMLAAVGLITKKDHRAIRQGLTAIRQQIRAGKFVFRTADEDIHMAVEAALITKIGAAAGKLHTARSRNDQVATDLRLWTRNKIDWLDSLLGELQRALVELAEKNRELVIPGYTHLQRAQPVLLAQHLLAYVEMLQRDRERLQDARRRVNYLPLGSGALAGTTLPIDRELVRRELGFAKLCPNSMDAVSDRDFVVEVLAALATLFIHLSRFAEDVILWASSEWDLLRLADAWSTGSSIMPQKRNPDLLELVRGKSGRMVGHLTGMLTTLKGLPMTYNRDLQEDKEPLFDAVKTAEFTLACLTEFVPSMKFKENRAAALCAGGFIEATVMAEYLVEKGLPFRQAHEIAGRLVRVVEQHSQKGASGKAAKKRAPVAVTRLADLPFAVLKMACPRFKEDIYARLDPARIPAAYVSAGSAGAKEVGKALRRWRKRLAR